MFAPTSRCSFPQATLCLFLAVASLALPGRVPAFDNVLVLGDADGLFLFGDNPIALGGMVTIDEPFDQGSLRIQVRNTPVAYGVRAGTLLRFSLDEDVPAESFIEGSSDLALQLATALFTSEVSPPARKAVTFRLTLDATLEYAEIPSPTSFVRASAGFQTWGPDPISAFIDCNHNGACNATVSPSATILSNDLQIVNDHISGGITVLGDLAVDTINTVDFVMGGLLRIDRHDMPIPAGMELSVDAWNTASLEMMAVDPLDSIVVIPVPATLVLFGSGLASLAGLRRMR